MIGIPKNEKIWLQIIEDNAVIGVITAPLTRDKYFLYEVKGNKATKTKYKSKDPTELEKKLRKV